MADLEPPSRERLSKMIRLYGYNACYESLVLLYDHFTSSDKYNTLADFVQHLNRVIMKTDSNSPIINPDLAHEIIQILCNGDKNNQQQQQQVTTEGNETGNEHGIDIPVDLAIRVKNIECDLDHDQLGYLIPKSARGKDLTDQFNIHYNFLYKRLNSLPIFKENFQLTRLATLTGSRQPAIKCLCFGLLIKDITKIDGYLLIDSTGRVPVRITPDTIFKNRLAYTNCIVLVEGVYVNPDDVLHAANVGLPPVLLDRLANKSLACQNDKLVILLKEIYMDEEDVCKAVEMLFTGYNSMEDPPIMFIMVGDFTRHIYSPIVYRKYTKKLLNIIRTHENLKNSHFVFVPGQRDTCQKGDNGELQENTSMPKAPLTKEHMPVSILNISGFKNTHLVTNPAHIYLGDRQISVVSHSYFKQLKKNLLHDLSDHNEEFFDTAKRIMLSNAHLAAGISKTYHGSMNLWHRPDLLVLADTEAFGNKYEYSSPKRDDTSFATLPSFSRQFYQFKVYYVCTGEFEDSQVTSEVLEEIIDDDDDDEEPEIIEEPNSDI